MDISSFNEYRDYLYLEKLHAGRHGFHWPLLRSREVQDDLTFFATGRGHFKPFFNSYVGDRHWVRKAASNIAWFTVDLDREGYKLECDLYNFQELINIILCHHWTKRSKLQLSSILSLQIISLP